jgi:hypothetical protein
MMKAAPLFAAAAAASLAACDQSPPTQPRQPIVVRSEAQDQLHQLDDLNRAIGLKRAIYQSGYTCKRVASSGYVQEHENLSMWMAKCDDGRDWAIFVGPDGTAQVRPCRDVAQLGLPACVMKGSKPAAG